MQPTLFISLGGILAALAVGLGAIGAHARFEWAWEQSQVHETVDMNAGVLDPALAEVWVLEETHGFSSVIGVTGSP